MYKVMNNGIHVAVMSKSIIDKWLPWVPSNIDSKLGLDSHHNAVHGAL